MPPSRFSRMEPLELRIAPAMFFLSGTQLGVVQSGGADANDAGLVAAAASDLAVVLKKGDSLVLDTDGDGVLDPGEVIFARVSGGRAAFFVTDRNSDGGVDADEVTGLAVSDGCKAVIAGDVHGDIVTTLAPDGTFTPAILLQAQISGLKVSGRVLGKLIAGGAIGNVTIGSNAAELLPSVAEIDTGLAGDGQSVSYNGGGLGFTLDFFAAPGAAGGSIGKVKLAGGTAKIQAGDGIGSATGAGGRGGSVSKITFLETPAAFEVLAGPGGASTAPGRKGGDGGSVTGLNLTSSMTAVDGTAAYLRGGAGGAGDLGGKGGGVSGASLRFNAPTGLYLYFQGGAGGDGLDAGRTGAGGAGGALSKLTVTALSGFGFAGFYGGEGGDAGTSTNGKGGAGGTISRASYQALDATYAPDLEAGGGGRGEGRGAGGKGGSLKTILLTQGATEFGQELHAGRGGDAAWGAGGAGGSLSKVTASMGVTGAYVHIFGGAGGNSETGAGGQGGSLSNLLFTGDDLGGEFIVEAGRGGASAAARGGAGGALKSIEATLADVGGPGVKILSGAGGAGGALGGGAGGAASSLEVTVTGAIAGLVEIGSGTGGNSSGDGARGGAGGALDQLSLRVLAGASPGQGVSIFAGGGGDATGSGGKGGNGGNVNAVVLDALSAEVQINYGPERTDLRAGHGGTGPKSAGGQGGGVSGVSGRVGVLTVNGQRGGQAEMFGGAGGSVKNLQITQVGRFVQLIAGGVGGDSAGEGLPGLGGSISGIRVAGDIGNSEAEFGLNPLATPGSTTPAMGGLIAGLGGVRTGSAPDPRLNGAISGVSAHGIAAILAGNVFSSDPNAFDGTQANGLTTANAVRKLSGIVATLIGADAVDPPGFTFEDGGTNAGFSLADGGGDWVKDGLVIVLGPTKLPVDPLMKVEVIP